MSHNDTTQHSRQPDPEPIQDGHSGEPVPRYTELAPRDGTDPDDWDSDSTSTDSIHVTVNNDLRIEGHGDVVHLPDVASIAANVLQSVYRSIPRNTRGRRPCTHITINANVIMKGTRNIATADGQLINEIRRTMPQGNTAEPTAAAPTSTHVVPRPSNVHTSAGNAPQVQADQQCPRTPAIGRSQQPASQDNHSASMTNSANAGNGAEAIRRARSVTPQLPTTPREPMNDDMDLYCDP
ncbi:uncharacterized protein EI97DRAFT_292436 [Westerdykella ornata]|uniref:Uncharacterized protein n=1 Tax=Westerdykella ornata TaxID=318751 RepID=A0A6A6JLC1_WESOR|nr:uncharacterized protein EI97DRAFT_292436 [Westerdykella ornata]KAF2277460.1 hypothetical protein EI97DRAFT_292436 [Westerdykella ornata]